MDENDEFTPEMMKKARERMGVSQRGLADDLQKSERYITYIESGYRKPELAVKYAIFWLMIPRSLRQKLLKRFFG